MAGGYDVPARLAQGRDAVGCTQAYVSACHRLGYRDPELTGYEGQLADRYDSDAGLDLRVLESDGAVLGALADTVDEAVWQQRGQLGELATAWRGPGAEAAIEFLRRHCDSATELAARLRGAARGCDVLAAELWRLVDAKVAAVLAVDDRVGDRRAEWLVAAHTVSSGIDDAHAAAVIDDEVMPYVAGDVRGEWVAAVRSAKEGMAAAYEAAVASAEPGAVPVFEIPGDFGPRGRLDAPSAADPPAATAAEVHPDPAVAGPAPGAVPEVPAGEPAAVTATAPAPPDDALSDLGAPPGFGLPGDLGLPTGGLPLGAGSGLGGLGGLGGLLPRLADALGDPGFGESTDDPAFLTDQIDEPAVDDRATDPESESDPAVEAAAQSEDPDQGAPADEAAPDEAAPDGVPVDHESVVDAGETDAEPAAEPVSDASEKTPCDIAAEELPQVGD